MELEKVKIHRIQQNGTAVSQITLDDDYNVPDYRPDIMKVLKENGELRFDEVKAANKAVWVKGSLVFHILYRCEQSDGKISCLKGEIPFQEKLNIDGLQENGEVHAAGEIEGESPVSERKDDMAVSRVHRDTRNLDGMSGDHPVSLNTP